MATKKPLRGKALGEAALAKITKKPKLWDQAMPYREGKRCGCFLHHVIVLSRKKYDGGGFTRERAAELLGTSWHVANNFFSGTNTLAVLKKLCKTLPSI